ncbi:MAG: hypothetical protein WDN00_14750 [Limisphaerales bacterium]
MRRIFHAQGTITRLDWRLVALAGSVGMDVIDAGDSSHPSRLPMAILFGLIAPVAIVYSFRSRRHAPDKLTALAAFVGSFIIAGFFLFMLAGLALWIYEIFTHAD